jgi:hypothetical protein
MPSLRLALIAALLSLGLARTAVAQTIAVGEAVERTYGFRPQELQPTWINYADCVGANGVADSFIFTVTHSAMGSNQLQVWAGSGIDCSIDENRNNHDAQCWKVYAQSPGTSPQKVIVNVQDIIAMRKPGVTPNGPGAATADDCDAAGSDQPTKVTLYFLAVDGGGIRQGGLDSYESSFDLIGPPAPTNVTAGIGEDQLFLKFTASNSSDLQGYRAYCDVAGSTSGVGGAAGTTGSGGASGAPGAAGAAGAAGSASLPDAGSASTDGGMTDGGVTDGGATEAGTSDAGGGGSGGGSAGNANCPSDALVPGEKPATSNQCGSTSNKGATKVSADGLSNFVTYAVAVAAVDSVGNVGLLSQVACGRPEPIDDFYELYTRAGGKGGGGFCAIGADPSNGVVALLGATLGAWLLRRRRRG